MSSSATATAGAGRSRTTAARSACPRCAGSCPAAAPSSAPRAPTRSRATTVPSGSLANLEAAGVDGLIAIGGEDTLGAASRLHDEHGLPVIGVPKTIDNDLGATDYTFGFDTAVNIAMEAIDRLHTTADSHHRVLIVEVMGRHAGWIAFHAGPRRRRQRDPDPGAASSTSTRSASWSGRRFDGPLRADRRRRRGGRAGRRHAGAPSDGKLDAFGHARLGGIAHWLEGRDRAPHRQGDARDGARPRPARRHPDRLRPGPGDPLRPARDRRRRGRPLGDDDGAARDRDRAGRS